MRFNRKQEHPEIRDYGKEPLICNINHAANMNESFRFALWTGSDMQLTLMSIPPRGEIGTEMHNDVDQLLSVESGRAKVYMGPSKTDIKQIATVGEDYVIIIPAGTWHNIVNDTAHPLKLYSLYAPPQHPFGTVQRTKADAEH